jgi:hypothetical protein
MMRELCAVAVIMTTMSCDAYAMRQHRSPPRMSCSEVRFYVAKYSAPVAEMYARRRGATDAQIERARRCLATEAAENGQGRF